MSISDPAPQEYAELWASIARLMDEGRHHDAVVTLRAVADASDASSVRISLGTLLAEQGDFHGAIREWTLVIDRAYPLCDRGALSAVYHNLAAVYRELGDLELARRFQQRSLTFQDDHGPAELLQLANDALWGRQWERAEMLLEAVEDCDSDADVAESLTNEVLASRGVLAGLRGQESAAVRLLLQAYHGHSHRGDLRLAGRDLINLAVMLDHQDRPGLGLLCLQQALRHCQAAADAVGCNRIRYLGRSLQRRQLQRRIQPSCN